MCLAQPLLDRAGGGWPPASFCLAPTHIDGLAPGKKVVPLSRAAPLSSAALGRLELALGSGDGLRGFNNSLQSRSANGPHVYRRSHADATPSALWLKVYPPACHPCIVLTSSPISSLCIFFSLGSCVPCVPGSAAVGPGGRRLAARLVCLAPTHTDRPCAWEKAPPFFHTQQGRPGLALGRGDGLYIYIYIYIHGAAWVEVCRRALLSMARKCQQVAGCVRQPK